MHIISHWDLDGIVSATLVARYALYREHYHVTKRLSTINAVSKFLYEFFRTQAIDPTYSHLFILDLNPLSKNFLEVKNYLSKILDYGIRVHWIDHHCWRSNYYEELKSMGVKIAVDQRRVTAEIIANKLNLYDNYSKALVDLARDDDLFLNQLDITTYWRRILRWFDWDIRYRALDSFIHGELWPSWARGLYGQIHSEYERMLNRTLSNTVLKNVCGYTIAISQSIDQRIHPGEIQLKLIESGFRADLYIIVYPSAVSLRSNSIDVSTLAQKLGGGGHRNASGIPLEDLSFNNVLKKIVEFIEDTKKI